MKLKPRHLALLEVVADPLDTRTYEEKCADVGYTRQTLWKLLREPEARKYLSDRVSALVGAGRAAAYRCLMRNIENDDCASARTYLQATGDIGTGGNVTHVNVTQNAGAEELYDAMARVADNRRRVLASSE